MLHDAALERSPGLSRARDADQQAVHRGRPSGERQRRPRPRWRRSGRQRRRWRNGTGAGWIVAIIRSVGPCELFSSFSLRAIRTFFSASGSSVSAKRSPVTSTWTSLVGDDGDERRPAAQELHGRGCIRLQILRERHVRLLHDCCDVNVALLFRLCRWRRRLCDGGGAPASAPLVDPRGIFLATCVRPKIRWRKACASSQ